MNGIFQNEFHVLYRNCYNEFYLRCVIELNMIYVFLVIIICFNTLYSNDSEQIKSRLPISILVQEQIKLFDAKDFSILKDFFYIMFRDNAFAYTLFSAKPMGIGGYAWDFVDASSNHYQQTRMMIVFKGWQVWQKYAHLFPSQNFYLIKSNPSNSTNLCFTIINKKRCEQVITEHLPVFQEWLGSQATVQKILDIVCSDQLELYNTKKGFTACLGILLGYGKVNSLGCERRSQLFIQALYRAPYHLEGLTERMKSRQGYFHIGLQRKGSMEGLEQPISIQGVIEELNILNETYKPIAFVAKDNLCPVRDFRCAGFKDDPETQMLKIQYESDYQKLVDIYNADNFLELILTQLSS